MALSPNGLASEIMNAMTSKLNKDNMADTATPELGHAIAKYLTKNTVVKYVWSGMIPGSPPTPDPITSYVTTKIVGDFICSPTLTSDSFLHGVKLGKQITDGIQKFNIFPAEGWLVPPGGFLCAPSIVLPPYPAQDSFSYWLFQSGIILSFYKAWLKPVPLQGMHGPYLAPPGAGAIMSLIY
jgi:hypothetical protein